LRIHRDADRPVVALEYPGGGGHPGAPSEALLKAQALAAYDWLDARGDAPIVVHGYSLGTGLAMHVAARRDVAGVLLDAPYVRMCELMTRQSAVPACWLPWVQKWDSARDVGDLSAPVQIQHGVQDQLIPLSDGQRLAAMMQRAGHDVTMTPLPNAGHTDIFRASPYEQNLELFVRTLGN